jgi:predicted GIY-YIG superfamily endonuclease
MPETDYNKTVIYKIINYEYLDLIYIGSTTNFKNRKNQHKNRATNINNPKYHLKLYENIRNYSGWDSWKMIVICEFPCKKKRQAEKEEDKYMMELNATLNTNRAFCSVERRQEIIKKSIDLRKERLGVEGLKEYNKIQDDKRRNTKKIFYLETRQDYLQEKVTCECGDIVCNGALTRHKKSNKHKLKTENN